MAAVQLLSPTYQPSFIKLALKSLRDVTQENTHFLRMSSLKQAICRTLFLPTKFLLTTWQKPSTPGEQSLATPSISDQRTLPNLPNEIWRRIIAFTIRLAGSASIELDDPFSPPYQNEEHPEVEPGLFEDRKALRLVCSSWRSVVVEIFAEQNKTNGTSCATTVAVSCTRVASKIVVWGYFRLLLVWWESKGGGGDA